MAYLLKQIWRITGGGWGIALSLLLIASVLIAHHGWLEILDSRMFALNAKLVAKPDDTSDIVVVTVPQYIDRADTKRDFSTVTQLVNQIRKQSPVAVAVLMNLPPIEVDYTLEIRDFMSDLQQGSRQFSKQEKERLNQLLQEAESSRFSSLALYPAIQHEDVLIGQRHSSDSVVYYAESLMLKNAPGVPASLIGPEWLMTYAMPSIKAVAKTDTLKNLRYQSLPVFQDFSNSAYRPLIWQLGDVYLPDMVSLLYARLIGSQAPVWDNGRGLQFDTEYRPTDWAGRIIPRASGVTGIEVDYPVYTAEQLSVKPVDLKNKVVMIGYENDPVLHDATKTLISLYTGGVYLSPRWTAWIVNGALLVMFLYMLFLLPKLQVGMGLVLNLFLLFALIVAQMGVLLVQFVWMPVVSIMLFLVLGHAVTLIRVGVNKRYDDLEQNVFEAYWMLGVYQYEQGEYDQSFASLQKCPTTDLMLEQMYRIGQAYEQRRQYHKALELYRDLNSRRPGYKAADKRIKSLEKLEKTQTTGLGGFNAARTLIMTNHGLQKPVLGRYELVRELGRGAMGVVYLGKDPKIVREVAIKTMDLSQYDQTEIAALRERFFREAETAGRLNHPNIVTIYDVGEEHDLAFMAMDYIVGAAMSEFVRKDHLLPIETVFKLTRQVAIALDYAHKAGVVHRDIKPSNIMYNKEEQTIKVTDFGIARISGKTGTHTGTILGSPLYMAPEQLSGIHVDGRADLFSLGVTLYQLLTGELPFKGDSLASLAYQITNVKHPAIRDIRPDLPTLTTRLVNKMLQKDPEKRFASGKDVAAAVIKVLTSMETEGGNKPQRKTSAKTPAKAAANR